MHTPRSICLILFALACTASSLLGNTKALKQKAFENLAPKEKFDSKKEGFIIITNNDLSHRLQSLQEFITHKSETQGYRMYVATEDDFGAGIGRKQAFVIRDWLQKNYKPLGLKYALFIGNGHPEEGDLPMIKAGQLPRPTGDRWDKLSDEEKSQWNKVSGNIMPHTGRQPTDYFYVDLQGDWDLDKDTTIGSAGDYKPGGITGQADLLVGRIPYYGEQSQYGKANDIDIILRRSIRYDKETDIAWRYNFTQLRQWDMIPAEVFFERDVLEKHGINYFRDKCYQDTIGFPAYHFHSKGDSMQHNVAKLARIPLGYTRLGGHGGPTGMHGINSGQVRQFLNDKQPTVVNMGGCDVGKIEHPQNLAYTLLRYHAIATHGGTRSVAGSRGNPSKPYVERLLEDGNTVGEAWWQNYADHTKGHRISPTTFLINIYGDPTVRPFPNGLKKLPYSFIAKPVEPYHGSVQSLEEIPKLPPHTIGLKNNSKKPITLSIISSEPWLIASKTEVSIQPGRVQKVKFSFDQKEARALSPGVHEAEILLDDGNGYSTKRLAYLELPNSSMIARFEFEDTDKHGYRDRFKPNIRFELPRGAEASAYQTKGIRGKAYNGQANRMRTGLDGVAAPNKGSYTIAFWLKKDASEVGRKQIFRQDRFLNIDADEKKLYFRMQDFNWYGTVKPNVFEKDFAIDWNGEWKHFAVTIDQIKGNVKIYIDSKLEGTINTKPQLILAAERLFLGKFKGALDELTIYNKAISESDIKMLYHDVFVDSPSPANKLRGILPGNVTLDFVKGSKVKDVKVSLAPYKNQKSGRKTITANAEGKFVATGIKPSTPYIWVVEYKFDHKGKSKKVRSPKWYFMTSENLIANSDFETSEFPWSGDARHEKNNPNRALHGNGSMVFGKGKSALFTSKEGIRAGTGYKLRFDARSRWKRLLHVEFFYKTPRGEKTLMKKGLHIYQDRRGKHYEMDFFAVNNAPYIGKKLHLRLTADAEEGDETWIDNISLTPYEHNSHNAPPEVITDPASLLATAEVGNNLFTMRLLDIVSDPEGSPISFEKASGPDWIRVRGQELMTNFGPTPNDLGENKVVVVARDAQGGSVEFTVPIKVEKQSSDEIKLLPYTAEVNKGHLRKNEQDVTGFKASGDKVTWKQALGAGLYDVTLIYSARPPGNGAKVSIALGKEKVEGTLSTTDFQAASVKLGQLNNATAGTKEITFSLDSAPKDKSDIKLVRILLTRVQ